MASAQGVTLDLSAASGSRGGSTTVNLTLGNSSSDQPAAIQWTLGYSTTDFSFVSVTAGPAATAASKSVSCSSASGVATCVLWGSNTKSVANGVVASVSLTLSSSTTDTSSQLQLSNASSADESGLSLSTSTAGSVVTILQPPGLNGFSCNPITLTPPATSTCKVALTSAVGSGGAVIGLTASPAEAGVPSSLTIPQGATSASFTVSFAAVTVSTPVTLAASYLGVKESLGITVNPPPVTLASLSVNPTNLTSGQTGSGTVVLSAPAGSGGVTVALSSSNPAAAVPSSVTVVQRSTSASFSVTTGSVSAVTAAVLTASSAGPAVTAKLTVSPAYTLSLSPAVNTVAAGGSASYTVTLSAPGALSGSVAFSASGLPSGTTATFSSSSLSGPGSSTLKLATSSSTRTGIYSVTVTGSNGGFSTSASATLAVVRHLGSGSRWFDLDIGSPAMAGSATYSSAPATFTVNGGGTGTGGTSDQCHYLYFAAGGNFTIVTQVASQQNTSGWAQAGLMIRSSLAANSSYVFLMVTPGEGASLQYRSATGGAAVNADVQTGPVAPYWLKLTRSGNQFTGYASANGTTWTELASVSVTMSNGLAAGFAVAADNSQALSAASFTQISVTSP